MAIAIVEELWTRIRAAIDDKIVAAEDAAASAEADRVVVEQAATSASWSGDRLTVLDATSPSLTGPKGDKGDTGARGPQGNQGPKGDKGDTGNQGPKGDKGDTGNQGPKGDKGDTGNQGPKGDKGNQGPKGDKGDAGEGTGDVLWSELTPTLDSKADKTYVDSETARAEGVALSRGQQTVVNGNGQLGGEHWPDHLTFVPTDAPMGTYGSWERPETSSYSWNSHDIVIDPTLPTYMSAYVRQAKDGGSGQMYLALAPVDKDGKTIGAVNVMYISGTLTTLAQDLKVGDKVVHLTSSENWGARGTPQSRRMIFWNYVSDSGYSWEPETYSRNVTHTDTWHEGGVNHETNTITLAAPWAGDPVPAGTYLSNGNNGNNYMYPASGTISNESWMKVEGIVQNKQDLTGLGFTPSRGWPPGVAAIRPGLLLNLGSSASNSNVRFANVYVSQLARLGHTHSVEDVEGLEDALDVKIDSSEATYLSGPDTQGKVVRREPNSENIRVGSSPTQSYHVTPKSYVDTEVGKKADTGHTHTASQISDATTVGRNVLKASSQANARSAIGAGTSNLAIGTTSSTAAAGNHTHTSSAISDKTHYGSAGNAGKVAGWGSDGHLYQSNDPTTDNHLTRKGYVDREVAKKANISHTHTSGDITDATDTMGEAAHGGKVWKLRPDGQVWIRTDSITENGHAPNKNYVDTEVRKKADKSHTHTSANITDARTWTGRSTDSNSIVKTDSAGWFYVGSSPTQGTHPANKSYVDGRTPEVRVVSSLPSSPAAGVIYMVTG